MIKRLTCLCILLSFLMIKHSPLFLIGTHDLATVYTTDEEQKEVPEETKGHKYLEFSDEETMDVYINSIAQLRNSQVSFFSKSPETTTVYLSVLNPPPDLRLS